MNVREQGFLLLTCSFGDSERKPLTGPQLRQLSLLARNMEQPTQTRALTETDLCAMGCEKTLAQRVLRLLDDDHLLVRYLRRGERTGCLPITRISDTYPHRLRRVLGPDAPGSLWCNGNADLLQKPKISLVGSRVLKEQNLAFAREVGKQAALQGYTLVSGNARGADNAAQESCLAHGGSVISVVADGLEKWQGGENLLYLSEEGFDLPFSSYRALHRNRIIHCISDKTFVAQCTLGKGGTWNGTCDNLRHNWSHGICFDDKSAAMKELEQRGATLIGTADLRDFDRILPMNTNLFEDA